MQHRIHSDGMQDVSCPGASIRSAIQALDNNIEISKIRGAWDEQFFSYWSLWTPPDDGQNIT